VHLLAFPSQARVDELFVQTILDSDFKDTVLKVNLRLHLHDLRHSSNPNFLSGGSTKSVSKADSSPWTRDEASQSFHNSTMVRRGPEESYADKKLSQKVGIYIRSIDDMHTPYEVPPENGKRTDTRWLKLRSKIGVSIRIVRVDELDGDKQELFNFSIFQLREGKTSH
jgi:hypothetical protein